jgi:hypothetical protein
MHDGDMLFVIDVVVESDHMELAEARRQVGDGGDLHADMLRPVALAGVIAAFIQ